MAGDSCLPNLAAGDYEVNVGYGAHSFSIPVCLSLSSLARADWIAGLLTGRRRRGTRFRSAAAGFEPSSRTCPAHHPCAGSGLTSPQGGTMIFLPARLPQVGTWLPRSRDVLFGRRALGSIAVLWLILTGSPLTPTCTMSPTRMGTLSYSSASASTAPWAICPLTGRPGWRPPERDQRCPVSLG